MWVPNINNPDSKFKVDSAGCNTNLEYSINGGEYKEFEYLDVEGYREWSSKETEFLDLNKKSNMLIVRRIGGEEIYLKAVLIQVGDVRVAIQNTYEGWTKGKGVNISNENEGKIEVSIDDGETFENISYGTWGIRNLGSASTELFSKNLVVRNKETGEEIYRTPEMEDIEEKIVYENGKTIVNFKNEDLIDNFTTYEYVIDGVSSYGDTVEMDDNTDITLKINTLIDFIEKSAQKEIKIDIVKVDTPIIEVNEEGMLNIVAGDIDNDELEGIFYSIDDDQYKEFSGKENLKPGTYKIKAYQVSKEKNIKSEIAEEEIVIEEKSNEEINNQNEEPKEDEEVNNESEQPKEDEETIDEGEKQKENEEANNENKQEFEDDSKNVNSKTSNKNTPQTGDQIIVLAIILASTVILNIFVKNRKNK